MMEKHFVTFYSPGTLFAEQTSKPIDSWDVGKASELAHEIVERHEATPYGFRFVTRSRGPDDLNSHQSAQSAMYFLGGKVETLAEIEARDDPKEEILRFNMHCNGYDKVITNTNSWRCTLPLDKDDVVLDWTPRKRPDAA